MRSLWLGLLVLTLVACSTAPAHTVAARIDEAQRFLPNNDACIDGTLRNQQLSSACVFGIAVNGEGFDAANADFAVIGDSHAMVIMNAVRSLAERNGLTGMNLTMSGCPPFEFAERIPPRLNDTQCVRFRKHVLAAARAGELPRRLIIHARWGIHFSATPFNNQEGGVEADTYHVFQTPSTASLGHEQALRVSLESLISELLALNHDILFVHAVPEMGWNVPDHLRSIYTREGKLEPLSGSVALTTYWARNRAILAATARWHERAEQQGQTLQLLYPHKFFCDEVGERCFAHLDGTPLYYDDDHVSTLGAFLLAQELGILNE